MAQETGSVRGAVCTPPAQIIPIVEEQVVVLGETQQGPRQDRVVGI